MTKNQQKKSQPQKKKEALPSRDMKPVQSLMLENVDSVEGSGVDVIAQPQNEDL